ncbi:MAG: MSMEG_1061 family FMN-dependent PPOX-type flavoprotein [Geminicoccaceae bacterium]
MSDDPHAITTHEQLRALVGQPGSLASQKTIDHIDAICARFIAASPFVVLATRGPDGLLDLSPKGDPAGFVGVLDAHTLALPDRPGNKRFDSYENLMVDPTVGLIFLIPGRDETLRVAGQGRIRTDPALLDRFAVDGRAPRFVLLVQVREAFLHCAKCMLRSQMWQPEHWPDISDVPSLAEAMMVHGRLRDKQLVDSTADMQAIIDSDARQRLY